MLVLVDHCIDILPYPIEEAGTITLPFGLVGFPKLNAVEILTSASETPFCCLREVNPYYKIQFVITNPFEFISDYQMDVEDDDLSFLNIEPGEKCSVFNILTIKDQDNKRTVTMNLIAPILINRKSLRGKQVILRNSHQYSARHFLFKADLNVEQNV